MRGRPSAYSACPWVDRERRTIRDPAAAIAASNPIRVQGTPRAEPAAGVSTAASIRQPKPMSSRWADRSPAEVSRSSGITRGNHWVVRVSTGEGAGTVTAESRITVSVLVSRILTRASRGTEALSRARSCSRGASEYRTPTFCPSTVIGVAREITQARASGEM